MASHRSVCRLSAGGNIWIPELAVWRESSYPTTVGGGFRQKKGPVLGYVLGPRGLQRLQLFIRASTHCNASHHTPRRLGASLASRTGRIPDERSLSRHHVLNLLDARDIHLSCLVPRLRFSSLSACISACIPRHVLLDASRLISACRLVSASHRANGPGFLRTHQLVIGGLHGVLFAVDHWTRVPRTLNSSDPSVRRGGHYSAWLRQR